MHSLVFKCLELPKIMDVDTEHDDKVESKDLSIADDCQSCTLETNTPHNFVPGLSSDLLRNSILPHSPTCSYGIQALINNVHQGYINAEDGNLDQINTLTAESSQWRESDVLRQWKMKKEVELEQRQRDSQAKQDHILEQAAIERENFYNDREVQITAKKRLNREREAKYHADIEAKQKLVEGNLWKAVASLIDLDSYEVDGKTTANSAGKLPKSTVELSTPRTNESKRSKDCSPRPTKKSANLSRMREILLKLQHQALVR